MSRTLSSVDTAIDSLGAEAAMLVLCGTPSKLDKVMTVSLHGIYQSIPLCYPVEFEHRGSLQVFRCGLPLGGASSNVPTTFLVKIM